MPITTVLRDNAPNILQVLGSFAGGFLGAVLVFKSKLNILELNQENIVEDIKELTTEKEIIKKELNKELKMIDARIDYSRNEITAVSTSVRAYQEGAKEWRGTQAQIQDQIFKSLSEIQNDIKGLIGKKAC